jgi:ribosomal protein L7/L12
MNFAIEKRSDGLSNITVNLLTEKDAHTVIVLLASMMFPATEELDEYIGVPRSVAAYIVQQIHGGFTKLDSHLATSFSQKIADIKYVRSVTSAGLKGAKDFVEKHITYRAPVAERAWGHI